ncbi:hypothetical protein BHE74_00002684 [Ensete ventricosum]|nr:hypothetical protein BHE74_00002684 [Ensete ventricosum]
MVSMKRFILSAMVLEFMQKSYSPQLQVRATSKHDDDVTILTAVRTFSEHHKTTTVTLGPLGGTSVWVSMEQVLGSLHGDC